MAFQELGLHEKLQFANRRAVGGGGGVPQKSKPPTTKTNEDIALITEALRRDFYKGGVRALWAGITRTWPR